MTQRNMPDVLYVDHEPHTKSGKGFLAWVDTMAKGTDTKYIRHGAPAEFIDPKVQPIPEGLADTHPMWIKYISVECEFTGKHAARDARELESSGRLLGYIILPQE